MCVHAPTLVCVSVACEIITRRPLTGRCQMIRNVIHEIRNVIYRDQDQECYTHDKECYREPNLVGQDHWVITKLHAALHSVLMLHR